jgi:thiol-disulfide isomerase/thioredoxin
MLPVYFWGNITIMKLTGRRDFLNTAAISFAAAGMVGIPKMLSGETVSRPNSELSSLRSADEWINSEALTEKGLRGKVVLIHFWTYTCINWMRTLPYVRAWSEKYKDKGLVVIGVHTPEFSFEQDIDNVRVAVKQLQVNYPVAAGCSTWDRC